MSTLPLRHVVVFDVGYVKGGGVFRPGSADGLEGRLFILIRLILRSQTVQCIPVDLVRWLRLDEVGL